MQLVRLFAETPVIHGKNLIFITRHKGVATLSVAIYKRAALCTQTLDFHYVEPGLEPPFVTPPFSTLISMTLKTKGHMQVVEHSRFLFNLKISIS